jgi:MFS family permease
MTPSMTSPSQASQSLAVIAALGVTQIIGYGTLYYAFAILAPSIAREFGTGEATLYAIFSAGLLAGGLAAPKAGLWMDRFGAPRLMALGSAAAAALLAGLASAPNLWVFGALVVAIEIISVAVLYDAAFATLAHLRKAEARRAITHLTLIAGFASTLFWPLTGWLSTTVGWRQTYLIFAGLHLLAALPLHLWIMRLRHDGEAVTAGSSQGLDFGPPLAGSEARFAFWAIAISFALSGVLTSALTIHLVPTLQSLELGATAYLVAMLMGPAQVLIRLTDALFWRSLHPLSVALIAAIAMPLAILTLLIPTYALAVSVPFAILLGINGGLSSIVRGTVPLVLFGAAGYGARLGQLAAIRTILSAGAPFLFAVTTQALGTQTALVGALAIGAMALVPLVMLRLRLSQRANRTAPIIQ